MHRIPSLALGITLVWTLSAVAPAQPGTVLSHQKISDTQGGRPPLDDDDRFGRSVASLGDLDGDGDTDESVPFDLDGNPPFVYDPNTPDTGNPDGVNPIVDLRAYEFQGQSGVTVLTFDDLGLPHGTIITDQYADEGVVFSPLNGQLELRTATQPIFPDEPQGLAEIPYFHRSSSLISRAGLILWAHGLILGMWATASSSRHSTDRRLRATSWHRRQPLLRSFLVSSLAES